MPLLRLAAASVLLLLCACSPRALILDGLATRLASQGAEPEDDLPLAREASAFYLKLSESVLRDAPGNLPLAQAVSAGFTQYAFAFVAFEADKLEAVDARRAYGERQRAVRLYRRAQAHALRALEHRHPGLRALLASSTAAAPPLVKDEVGLAYWGAAAWGARIALTPDDAVALAELPQAMRLADWAWAVFPEFGEGALASLMGSFENARPGGSPEAARRYYDRAIAIAAGRNAGVFVAKAEGDALPSGDRSAFESLLRQALATRETHQTLANAAMAQRAQWLLDTVEDRF